MFRLVLLLYCNTVYGGTDLMVKQVIVYYQPG